MAKVGKQGGDDSIQSSSVYNLTTDIFFPLYMYWFNEKGEIVWVHNYGVTGTIDTNDEHKGNTVMA